MDKDKHFRDWLERLRSIHGSRKFKNSNHQLQDDWNSSGVALSTTHKDKDHKGLSEPSEDKRALVSQNLPDHRFWNHNLAHNETVDLTVFTMSVLSNDYENRLAEVIFRDLVMDYFERNECVREEIGMKPRIEPEFEEYMDNYVSKDDGDKVHSKILHNINDLVEEAKVMAVFGLNVAKRKAKCDPLSNSLKLNENVLLYCKLVMRKEEKVHQISSQRMSQNTRRIRLQMRRRAEERYNAMMTDDSSDEHPLI